MRKRGKKAGRPQECRLQELPPELLHMIISLVHPDDLLRLMLAYEFLRVFLSSEDSSFVWKSAEKECGLPGCPKDLTHLQYVELIFGNTCSLCGSGPRGTKVFFAFRVCLCKKCFSENVKFGRRTMFWPDIMKRGESERDDMFWLTPAFQVPKCDVARRDEVRWDLTHELCIDDHQSMCCVFYVPDFGAAIEEYKSLPAAERKKFATKRRKDTIIIKEHTHLVLQWYIDKSRERRSGRDRVKAAFRDEVYRRLEEMGYTDSDMDFDTNDGEIHRKWKALVAAPKRMTNRVWGNLYPKAHQLIQLRRSKVLERAVQKRRAQLAQAAEEIMSSNKDRFITADDFTEFPIADEVIHSANSHVFFTDEQLESLKEQVLESQKGSSELLEEYCARLLLESQLNAGHELSAPPDRSVIDLRTSFFLYHQFPSEWCLLVVDFKILLEDLKKRYGEAFLREWRMEGGIYVPPFSLIEALLEAVNLPGTTHRDMVMYGRSFKCLRCWQDASTWFGLVVHFIRENKLNDCPNCIPILEPDEDNDHYWDESKGPLACYDPEAPQAQDPWDYFINNTSNDKDNDKEEDDYEIYALQYP